MTWQLFLNNTLCLSGKNKTEMDIPIFLMLLDENINISFNFISLENLNDIDCVIFDLTLNILPEHLKLIPFYLEIKGTKLKFLYQYGGINTTQYLYKRELKQEYLPRKNYHVVTLDINEDIFGKYPASIKTRDIKYNNENTVIQIDEDNYKELILYDKSNIIKDQKILSQPNVAKWEQYLNKLVTIIKHKPQPPVKPQLSAQKTPTIGLNTIRYDTQRMNNSSGGGSVNNSFNTVQPQVQTSYWNRFTNN